ncbi:MAG: SDR family NAD(P)-dependent oxidoreductase, partial [Anaerolineae bacterium]|nr:SDR family NAD(P)-dependent oxidoreductase [Anaerolineae bacterium]
REWVDHCSEILQPELGCDLRPYLFGEGRQDEAEALARAAVFVIEYALAQLLQSWGIEPAATVGHGLGEYVAACVDGVISLEEALRAALSDRPEETPIQETLATLLAQPEMALLVVGADQGLAVLLRQHPAGEQERVSLILSLLPGAAEPQPERAFVLAALGKLWLAGVEIEWTAVWQPQSRRRLALPTYPFELLRFWVEENATPLPIAKPTGKKQDIGDWFYLPTWKQTKVWSQVEQEQATAVPAVWLIFADQQGVGDHIADRLEWDGDAVFRVHTGAVFAAAGDNRYHLNPADPLEYRQLLRTLPAFPTHIVHLWGMDAEGMAETPVTPESQFAQAQQCGFYSLLFLAQAMDRYADALSIWAISANAQPVTGGETVFPERATILGACRVMAQENANIRCGYLDIEWPPPSPWQAEWLAGQVVAEIKQPADELAVAYRGQRRWVQTFAPVSLPEGRGTAVWRPQGVYLIVGGLGGIGLILARRLAQVTQARLVLTTRGAFPPPDTWSSWLANHDKNDPTSQKIRHLQEIEALGGLVRVIQADVADEAQMRAMLTEAEAEFGPLHGVFYTAGVSGRAYFAPVQELAVAQCEAHFRPKAYGLLVLEKVLAGRQLDFCVLFSSLSSILGGLGFAAYTAANAFIDAFVHQHNQQHAQWWSCVNWDTWQIVADAHAGLGATVAQFEMQPAEALQALTRVIANGPVTQLVNSTGDLEARLDQWVRMLSIHAGKPAGSQASTHPRPDLMTAYAPPTNETETIIGGIWEQVLGIAPIGIHDNFLELGGHSLMAMEVLSQLRHRFQVHLPLTLLFEAPTVQQTALAVELAIIEELEAELTEEEIEPYDVALLAS